MLFQAGASAADKQAVAGAAAATTAATAAAAATGAGAGSATAAANGSAAALMKQGIDAYNRKDFPTAIKALSARVRMMPQDPDAYYYLGNSYVATSQAEQAAQAYACCVRLAPQSPAGQFALTALERVASTGKKGSAATVAANEGESEIPGLDAAGVARVQAQIAASRKELDNEINRLNEHLSADLNHLPNDQEAVFRQHQLQEETKFKIENMRIKQWRAESRMVTPEQIDTRCTVKRAMPIGLDPAVVQLLQGIIGEGNAPAVDKDKDYKGTTPAVLSMKDVAPALSTASERDKAHVYFIALKQAIERRQDAIDEQIWRIKKENAYSISNLEHNPSSLARRGRFSVGLSDEYQAQVTVLNREMQARIDRLQDDYNKELASMVASTKAKIAAALGHS